MHNALRGAGVFVSSRSTLRRKGRESMSEQPQRYCSNCGHELSPEDQFCPNCGTPVHRAATVPTPEADVPVPPPPEAEGTGAPDPGQPAQQPGWGRRHPILTGCLGIIVLLVLLGVLVTALSGGGGNETAGGGGGGGAGGNEPAQNQ